VHVEMDPDTVIKSLTARLALEIEENARLTAKVDALEECLVRLSSEEGGDGAEPRL